MLIRHLDIQSILNITFSNIVFTMNVTPEGPYEILYILLNDLYSTSRTHIYNLLYMCGILIITHSSQKINIYIYIYIFAEGMFCVPVEMF